MPPESPSSRSRIATPTPPQQQPSPSGYADAARQSSTNKHQASNRKPLPRNSSIVLYSNSQYDHLLTTDPALLAMARSQNPNSVVFNFQQLCSVAEVEDLLINQLGPVVALKTRTTPKQHLLAEVLFRQPEHRQKAVDSGITVKNERILALPHVAADTNLLKVNLYQLPVCDPKDLKDELFTALSIYGQIAQIRAYVSHKHHVFKGEATALLDVSLWGDRPPKLPRFLHLEFPFPSRALLRAKGMPPFCGYCQTEGHFSSKCNVLKLQRNSRPQPCTSCGGRDHINDTDVRCTNYFSPVPSPSVSPQPSRPPTPVTRSEQNLAAFDTYMAERRHGTTVRDSKHAPIGLPDTCATHHQWSSEPSSPEATTPTTQWQTDFDLYQELTQRLTTVADNQPPHTIDSSMTPSSQSSSTSSSTDTVRATSPPNTASDPDFMEGIEVSPLLASPSSNSPSSAQNTQLSLSDAPSSQNVSRYGRARKPARRFSFSELSTNQ